MSSCPAVSCSRAEAPLCRLQDFLQPLLLLTTLLWRAPGQPLRHSAYTPCLAFSPKSLPASVSPKAFPGSPENRQGRSVGLCGVLTANSTKHPSAGILIHCPSPMTGELEE